MRQNAIPTIYNHYENQPMKIHDVMLWLIFISIPLQFGDEIDGWHEIDISNRSSFSFFGVRYWYGLIILSDLSSALLNEIFMFRTHKKEWTRDLSECRRYDKYVPFSSANSSLYNIYIISFIQLYDNFSLCIFHFHWWKPCWNWMKTSANFGFSWCTATMVWDTLLLVMH